jgi:hypothetical protein
MKLHANAVEAAPRRHRDRSSNQARSEDTGYRRGCLGHGAAKESNLPSVGLPRPAGFEDQRSRALICPLAGLPQCCAVHRAIVYFCDF